jgi:hypothetical protein
MLQMWRMEDVYRERKTSRSLGFAGGFVNAAGYTPDESVLGARAAASRRVWEAISTLVEPGHLPRFYSRFSVLPLSRQRTVDPYLDPLRSEVMLRLTGTVSGVPKGQPGREGVLGWETEQRWDAERKQWVFLRVTIRPLDDPPKPRLRIRGSAWQ